MKRELGRRAFFRNSSAVGLGLIAVPIARAADVVTPPQTEGPFYPVRDQLDKDVDLTRVPGRNDSALGTPVVVKGRVLDENDQPLTGAVIDVWQACESGRYNHPRDPNTSARLDPNFQYFARLMTDNRGQYQFKTIIPGAYPASGDWTRPPHIHFRVDAWGKRRLTTQMYFKGQQLNDVDQILQQTEQQYGRAARESLVVDFSQETNSEGTPVGTFDIVIGRTPNAD